LEDVLVVLSVVSLVFELEEQLVFVLEEPLVFE
jgi:hypothetical protein